MTQAFPKSYPRLESEKDVRIAAHGSGRRLPGASVLSLHDMCDPSGSGNALPLLLADIIVRRRRMQDPSARWMAGFGQVGRIEGGRGEREGQALASAVGMLGLSPDPQALKLPLSGEMHPVVNRIFVRLFREGIILRGPVMSPWCPGCRTALSRPEIRHREIAGKIAFIRHALPCREGESIEVAFPRLELMLGMAAVAVNPRDRRYRRLIGSKVVHPLSGREIPIIGDAQVKMTWGNGAVQVVPAHDPHDMHLAKMHRLPCHGVVDESGLMAGPIPAKYVGLGRAACRAAVLRDLRRMKLVAREERYQRRVGYCHLCGSQAEFLITGQWLLHFEALAGSAMEWIRGNRITFFPMAWEKACRDLLENPSEWCLSRQNRQGHPIPAFYCSGCGEMTVAAKPPAKCRNCHSRVFHQGVDVLDSWFLALLWPWIASGWLEEAEEPPKFDPSTLVVVGADAFSPWVARMIMLSIHFFREPPFREVLVCGPDGFGGSELEKVVAPHGADVSRFMLAIRFDPGKGAPLSADLVKASSAFARKVWNAARFVAASVRGDEGDKIDLAGTGACDQWLLHHLNRTIYGVNSCLDDHRLREAADLLTRFVRTDFCSWYIEFSRSELENIATRQVLKGALLGILQLLHPFMPFLCDTVHRHIWSQGSLMQNGLPRFNPRLVFREENRRVGLLMQLISATRRIRAENRIPPGSRLTVYLQAASARKRDDLRTLLLQFTRLTGSREAFVVEDLADLGRGYGGKCMDWDILLPFGSGLDWQSEVRRLESELGDVVNRLAALERDLASPGFCERVPDAVVHNLKKRLLEAFDRKIRIEKILAAIS